MTQPQAKDKAAEEQNSQQTMDTRTVTLVEHGKSPTTFSVQNSLCLEQSRKLLNVAVVTSLLSANITVKYFLSHLGVQLHPNG
jgi:hypothetical protein